MARTEKSLKAATPKRETKAATLNIRRKRTSVDNPFPPGSIEAKLRALGLSIPEEELSKIPTDLASEHDHYLYGTPKRYSRE